MEALIGWINEWRGAILAPVMIWGLWTVAREIWDAAAETMSDFRG